MANGVNTRPSVRSVLQASAGAAVLPSKTVDRFLTLKVRCLFALGGGRCGGARRGGQLQALQGGERGDHAAQRAPRVAGDRARGRATWRVDLDAADADRDAQRVVDAVRVGKAEDLQHAVQQPDEALIPPAGVNYQRVTQSCYDPGLSAQRVEATVRGN